MLDFIIKYWLQWVFGLIAAGAVWWAKRYIKLEKKNSEEKWKDKEKNMCGKIISTLQEQIQTVEDKSKEEDNRIYAKIEHIEKDIDTNTAGILSIQGKQFKDFCRDLLQIDHIITVDEFEEFEAEYEIYKNLGGNHKGDALHDSVVTKFNSQIIK